MRAGTCHINVGGNSDETVLTVCGDHAVNLAPQVKLPS